ncbi:nuclear transport factor 2 family protein [Phenylobacterium sp.]|uniref:nuclear transport factor 2 family protein n=1 Tax=Phenylobacterium sp. TaxID=1871053 RepID=UPI0035AEBAF9
MPEESFDPGADDRPPDYDTLLQGNLARVFNERSAEARAAALAELWAEDGELVEPDRVVLGYAAISEAVAALHSMLPPGAAFVPTGPVAGHHGVGRLNWRAVGPDGGVLTTGTDVAIVRGGRIGKLFVLLDG